MPPSTPTPLDAEHEAAFRAVSSVHAELCVLLARAMNRHCGRDWFRVVCPRPVFERLIERKEREVAIDRTADEYQELMTFADFHDMADMIAGSGGVSKLFRKLAATEDDLLEILDHLERCRRHLILAHRLSPADLELARSALEGFESFTGSAKEKVAAEEGDAPPPPWTELKEVFARGGASMPTAHAAPIAEPAPAASDDTRVSADPDEAASHAAVSTGPDELPATIADAVRADDLRTVMRALRAEVVELANELLGGAEGGEPVLWRGLQADGWQARHHDLQGLDRLTGFYTLFDRYQTRQREGLDAAELAELANEHQLPQLLMELRDIFNAVAAA